MICERHPALHGCPCSSLDSGGDGPTAPQRRHRVHGRAVATSPDAEWCKTFIRSERHIFDAEGTKTRRLAHRTSVRLMLSFPSVMMRRIREDRAKPVWVPASSLALSRVHRPLLHFADAIALRPLYLVDLFTLAEVGIVQFLRGFPKMKRDKHRGSLMCDGSETAYHVCKALCCCDGVELFENFALRHR